MFVELANSKILFAANCFQLFSIYHGYRMICRVLSEPCVYISSHYRNVQGAAGADDFGTGVPDSRSALSRHRFGAARIVTHYCSGGWSV